MSLDSRYAGSGFKVDVYKKSIHKAKTLAMVRISRVEGNSRRCPASERSVHNGT